MKNGASRVEVVPRYTLVERVGAYSIDMFGSAMIVTALAPPSATNTRT